MKDDQNYLQEVRRTLAKEEENINQCTQVILKKLKINKDVF